MSHTSQCHLKTPSLSLGATLKIANLLSKSDLNSFCRTSRYFLVLLRPKLYREVCLSAVEPPLEAFEKYFATLKLLASDPKLAQYVHELYVHGPSVEIAPKIDLIPDFYLRAIQNMPSLKKLGITGSIIRDVAQQKALVETLSRLDPPLEEFNFEEFEYCWSMPGPNFPLSSLTKLNWMVPYTYSGYPPPMFSALEASKETLRTLILNFDALLSLGSSCQRLWDLRFPRVDTLIIGVWQFYAKPSYPAAFTGFLVAHGDSLVELDLAYDPTDHCEYGNVFHGYLRSDSLPNLRRFKGHIAAFLEMVATRMECLRSLQSLDVGSKGGWESVWGFRAMFNKLDRWRDEEVWDAATAEYERKERGSILTSLTHLGLRLDRSLESEISADDVFEVGKRCAEHFGETRYRSLVREYRFGLIPSKNASFKPFRVDGRVNAYVCVRTLLPDLLDSQMSPGCLGNYSSTSS